MIRTGYFALVLSVLVTSVFLICNWNCVKVRVPYAYHMGIVMVQTKYNLDKVKVDN